MKKLIAILLCTALPVAAQEPESCLSPKFSDVGWTDITATTAIAARVLEELGYTPEVQILSVAVTFESLKQGDTDIFLGNWMPLQEPIQTPLVEAGQIDVIRPVLDGARIGLAVPKATYDAGLKTYADIASFRDQLGGQIYGIEAGSSANATIMGMIEQDKFGLNGFNLVESSEQGMLAQVQRATGSEQPIVFFGWQPHPMNVRMEMEYLTNGDDVFGPQDGAASVLTNTRAGYAAECPNVGKFLSNLSFTVAQEDVLMTYILDEGLEPGAAAERWLGENPDVLDGWMEGVTTAAGEPGLDAVKAALE